MSARLSMPTLKNQYRGDRVLQSYLTRTIPPDVLEAMEPELDEMGELAGGELYQMQLADRLNEPTLTQWDAWGERIDYIEVSPLWRVAELTAAQYGVIASAYEKTYGRYSRVHQFTLAYLFTSSTDIYSCPLAMTDGAAQTLIASGNQSLIKRAVPHLTTRNPQSFWTSGQWMTEIAGGSDVSRTETVARRSDKGVWRLYGRKWFTSAINSQMALTLARPEGNEPGSKGLALFYLETRDENQHPNHIQIDRLKDKLGTRKVPTAELTLKGTMAALVKGTTNGVRNITPMLNITRTWNAISAISLMRRGLTLAYDFARKRYVFGSTLAEKPLHVDTLADLQAEFEAAFHLTFTVVELVGLQETGEITPDQVYLLRLLTPIAKLMTGRQVVAVLSEVLEAFGGAGYVEDTGLPMLLRDAQVLPIWEGTTNVLSMDVLGILQKGAGIGALKTLVKSCMQSVREKKLIETGRLAQNTLNQAEIWLKKTMDTAPALVETGARRFALTLGRAVALGLLVRQAQWSLDEEQEGRAIAAATRFARNNINLIRPIDLEEAFLLMNNR